MLEFCQNLIILSKRIYALKIFFFKYLCLVSRITSIAYNLSINRHFRTSISIFIFASRIYLFLNERIFFNFINILYIYCNNEQRYQYFFPPTSNLKVEKKKKRYVQQVRDQSHRITSFEIVLISRRIILIFLRTISFYCHGEEKHFRRGEVGGCAPAHR